MILHFIADEKFSDYAIRQFSGGEMHSRFVLVSFLDEIKYTTQLSDVEIVNPCSSRFVDILNQLGDYKAVVLHGLFWPWEEEIFKAIPDAVKLCWVFWGGEIYGRSDLVSSFLAPKTKRLFFRKQMFRFIKNGLRKVKQYEFPKLYFARIDYCLTDVHEDFLFAKKYMGNSMKELWYNYYSIEETIGSLDGSICNGSNILFGNSCSIECNHLDGFSIIKRHPHNQDRQIIIPLSYGEPWLRTLLLKKVKQIPGILPLVDFLPRDEYNKYIQSCSTVIMNHYRQQAFGNILTSLWLGSRVYLSKQNLLYDYFNRIGCSIHCIEDEYSKNSDESAFGQESDEVRNNTRNILMSIYGKTMMLQKIKELIEELEK